MQTEENPCPLWASVPDTRNSKWQNVFQHWVRVSDSRAFFHVPKWALSSQSPVTVPLVMTPSRRITLEWSNWPIVLASMRKSCFCLSEQPTRRVWIATGSSRLLGSLRHPWQISPNIPAQEENPMLNWTSHTEEARMLQNWSTTCHLREEYEAAAAISHCQHMGSTLQPHQASCRTLFVCFFLYPTWPWGWLAGWVINSHSRSLTIKT